jgi:hypothetical protein
MRAVPQDKRRSRMASAAGERPAATIQDSTECPDVADHERTGTGVRENGPWANGIVTMTQGAGRRLDYDRLSINRLR